MNEVLIDRLESLERKPKWNKTSIEDTTWIGW